MRIHRHGEVILKEIDAIPEGAQVIETSKSIIVGHSESGHHHVLTSPMPIVMLGFNDKTYLQVEQDAKLLHQKSGDETHGTQIIARGFYERTIKESFSYAQKIMRRVVD